MTLAEVAENEDRVLIRLDNVDGAPLFQVCRFEGGHVVRIDDFVDPRKARKAAGLPKA